MSRRPLALVLTVGAFVVPLLMGSSAVTQAQPAQPSGRVAVAAPVAAAALALDAKHPYSDPLYWPVRQPMRMDCFKKNPGCTSHSDWQLSLVSRGNFSNNVYSMGAGKVVKVATGKNCGRANTNTSFGTQIDIDHGGGVMTRYGHLKNGTLKVKRGQLVTAGQVIAKMGNTGARTCAQNEYLDFLVKQGKRQINFKTLKACMNGAVQVWPKAQYPQFNVWNAVPRYGRSPHAEFPNPRRSQTEKPDGRCLPQGVPASPNKPQKPTLARAGGNQITASWTGQPKGTRSMVELQVYRVSVRKWLTEEYRYVGTDQSRTTFTGLTNGLRTRVALSHKNPAGWSTEKFSTEQVVGAAPRTPSSRGLSTGVASTTKQAYVRWAWKGGTRRGYAPTRYLLEIRKSTTDPWTVTSVGPNTYSYRWDGLAKGTQYQVRVRARSAAGYSGYLIRNVLTGR